MSEQIDWVDLNYVRLLVYWYTD